MGTMQSFSERAREESVCLCRGTCMHVCLCTRLYAACVCVCKSVSGLPGVCVCACAWTCVKSVLRGLLLDHSSGLASVAS